LPALVSGRLARFSIQPCDTRNDARTTGSGHSVLLA
jgi:hypothetical protein